MQFQNVIKFCIQYSFVLYLLFFGHKSIHIKYKNLQLDIYETKLSLYTQYIPCNRPPANDTFLFVSVHISWQPFKPSEIDRAIKAIKHYCRQIQIPIGPLSPAVAIIYTYSGWDYPIGSFRPNVRNFTRDIRRFADICV